MNQQEFNKMLAIALAQLTGQPQLGFGAAPQRKVYLARGTESLWHFMTEDKKVDPIKHEQITGRVTALKLIQYENGFKNSDPPLKLYIDINCQDSIYTIVTGANTVAAMQIARALNTIEPGSNPLVTLHPKPGGEAGEKLVFVDVYINQVKIFSPKEEDVPEIQELVDSINSKISGSVASQATKELPTKPSTTKPTPPALASYLAHSDDIEDTQEEQPPETLSNTETRRARLRAYCEKNNWTIAQMNKLAIDTVGKVVLDCSYEELFTVYKALPKETANAK